MLRLGGKVGARRARGGRVVRLVERVRWDKGE